MTPYLDKTVLARDPWCDKEGPETCRICDLWTSFPRQSALNRITYILDCKACGQKNVGMTGSLS